MRPGLRTLLVVAALGLACAGLPDVVPIEPPRTDWDGTRGAIDIDIGTDARGERRSARIYVPQRYDPSRPWPVVWVFHGGRDTTANDILPHWEPWLDGDFIAVFPNGQRTDRSSGGWYADRGDDTRHVDVIRRLHAEVSRRFHVDRHYATGFSSGAHMTWQLACQAPELFAGFAPVGHYLLASYASDCDPAAYPPLVLVGSVDDPVAPYEGRPAADGRPHNLGAAGSMKFWTRRAGCQGSPREERLAGARGVRMTWRGCAAEHVRLQGIGHVWPPSGTDLVLDGFRRHAGL